MAVAALIVVFFVPLIGLILGYVAKNQIRQSRWTLGGNGLATAAIVIGWIFTALGTVWMIAVISAASHSSYY
jgi:hypothetical protein